MTSPPILITLAGLPGTGKSTIARALAEGIGAVWLRIDTIEQAILRSGSHTAAMNETGYLVAYSVAADNLRLGHSVIADCVNPWMLTRDAWRDIALHCNARILEVEIICSNESEHRRRVEARTSDIDGHTLPDWKAVTSRDYHAWTRDRLAIDTANRSTAECVSSILAAMPRE